MNRKKELLQPDRAVGEYLAPKVKVISINPRRMLCSSTETYGEGDNLDDYFG